MNDLMSRLELARVVLHELTRGPLSRTSLEKRVPNVSHACFEGIFKFLVEDGNIKKCGVEHLAPWRITEKGRAGLVWREMR